MAINDTLNTMNALLNQQGDVLTNGVGKIIEAATHYSFESDDSVVLSGPLGNLWVFQDGTTYPASVVPGTNGYPAYSVPVHLERAKQAAREILGLLPVVEMFGRKAELIKVEVPNGTDCPDFRDVYYFLDNEDVYNAGYRSGGTWVDGWWA